MNWINIEVSKLRAIEYIGSDPVHRATWLNLLAYCAQLENGGRITSCRRWKSRAWEQAVGVTAEEVLSPSALWSWDGDDLVVWCYPAEKENEVRKLRELSKVAGVLSGVSRRRMRSESDETNRAVEPHGSTETNRAVEPHGSTETNRAVERNRIEGNGIELPNGERTHILKGEVCVVPEHPKSAHGPQSCDQPQPAAEKAHKNGSQTDKSQELRLDASTNDFHPLSAVQTPPTPEKSNGGPIPCEIEPIIPTVDEVVAFGTGAGVPPEYCAHYHERRTVTRSWITRHGVLIDWKRDLVGATWWGKDRATWRPESPRGVSPSVKVVLAQNELERVEREIERIRSSHDCHTELSAEERKRLRALKEHREVLKRQLGFKV